MTSLHYQSFSKSKIVPNGITTLIFELVSIISILDTHMPYHWGAVLSRKYTEVMK